MNSRLTECTKMRSEPARSHGSHHAAPAGASVVCINTDSLIYILFLKIFIIDINTPFVCRYVWPEGYGIH